MYRSTFRPGAVLVFLALGCVPVLASDQEPFEIRGWDIERCDPDYVRDAIRRAHDAGMNTISLSHEVVMNAEEILLDWHRYKHLQDFCELAHTLGMKVYFWNHQVNNPPASLVSRDANGKPCLDFDNPELTSWLHDRYDRVADRVPGVDGIILSLTESEWQVHRETPAGSRGGARVISKLSPAERMAKVINTIHDSLHAHGKRLIVRDFLRTPTEMDAFLEALRKVPEDVWVYSKCVPNDWQYRYPPHPLLGKVAPHKQIMELDVNNETGGNMRIAMLAPLYYQKQIQLAHQRGLAGVIARTDDGFRSNRGKAAEFNVFSYSRLLHAPDADVDAMWPAFFTPRYGREAAPVAIACLKESFDLVCALHYTLGFWTGSGAPNVAYTDDHLVHNSSALWSEDPQYKKTEQLLLISGPETVERVVAEKRAAEQTATRCLKMLADAQVKLAPDQLQELQGYFEEARQQARIGQVWGRAYFALRWYRNAKSPEARSEVKAALRASQEFVTAQSEALPPSVRSLDEQEQARFLYGNLNAFNRQLSSEIDKASKAAVDK